jgi:16S rRNA (guanine527-N7)-methyltransferase
MITPESIQEKLENEGLIHFFSPEALDSLVRFTRRMLEFNVDLNLTKFVSDDEVLNFHILDSAYSLPLIKKIQKASSESWMDLGTGCGFPGAVLIAAFPQLDMTLMDATHKKVMAMQTCVESAGWSAKTLCGRAEEIGRDPQFRESFDGIVARAVADLQVVLEYAIPLLKPGGHLVNWLTESQFQFVDKSRHALEELKSNIVEKSPYFLMEGTQKRFLVLVEKMGKTQSHYPRGVGVPFKKPL